MTRFALAVAIAFCLAPSSSYAQTSRFTVTAMTANVYAAPSVRSAVVGHRARGAVLEVRREVGDWIEVAWPGTAKGVAYVPAPNGWMEKPWPTGAATEVQQPQRPMTIDEFVHGRSTLQSSAAQTGSSAQNPAAYVAEAVAAVSAASTPRANVMAPSAANATYVAPAHFVGLGARINDLRPTLGATGRVWTRTGVGVQVEMARDARTNAVTAERMTSLQFAPSVLLALPNAVSDYFWVRPYVGGGAIFDSSTLRSTDPGTISLSDRSFGLQLFGGGELTFAGLPRFALSADAGVRRMPTTFAGFEPRKMRFTLAGHWFVH